MVTIVFLRFILYHWILDWRIIWKGRVQMSIKDVTAVIDAKAIKRYCDSKKVNGECGDDCVFNGNLYCILPDILGVNGQDCYMDAKQKIREKISELSK